jgi:tetratricopeptide (TPR) repeat protein
MSSSVLDLLGLRDAAHRPLRALGEAGYLWYYAGDLTRARAAFEALSILAPRSPAGPLGIAKVLLQQSQLRAADRQLDVAMCRPLIRSREIGEAQLFRGYVMLGLRKIDQAVAAWTKAVQLDAAGTGQEAQANLDQLRLAGLLPQPVS